MVIGSAGCGESDGIVAGPPIPGSISLSTETSGFLKDDSYELLVDGQSQGTIGANDRMTISGLDPATYEVNLGDVASNCTVESVSVSVSPDATTEAALAIACAHSQPDAYSIRFSRGRPDLDTGELTECPFGLCPTEEGWDLYVYYSYATDPNSVIRQNQTTGVEIAHLPGVSLQDLTEADLQAATFTTNLVGDPFDAGRVILIRTDAGNVYALGNPVEDDTAQTLSFDAALIARP
ncbi:MAG TPA: hypothetical protein VLD62_05350 [Acidimicrobiia bacterium]|nr:hypothetical protein [Acidimicrobiia bacterium]